MEDHMLYTQFKVGPPQPEQPSSDSDQAKKATMVLTPGQASLVFYPGQEQAIWPKFKNDGPDTADTVVLDAQLPDGVTVSEVYAGPCPQTKPGDTKIHCEWTNVEKGNIGSGWAKITLKLAGNKPAGQKLSFPMMLTSYIDQQQTDQAQVGYIWDVKKAPFYKQTDLSKFPQTRKITVSAQPSSESERKRLAQNFVWADFQPTGFYLNPLTNLTVTVSGVDEKGPRPELVTGTPALVNAEIETEEVPTQLQRRPLQNGTNTISDYFGGILYVGYAKEPGQTAPDITVTLGEGDAAQPFPFYQQGKITNDQWAAMLNASKVPVAEHVSDRAIVTGLVKYAKQYMSDDQATFMDTYNKIVNAQDTISGLEPHAPNPIDRPSPLRPMVVQTNSKGCCANSTHYRAAIPVNWENIYTTSAVRKSWGIWHELGHHRQHGGTWSWGAMGEDTVNIYSLAARRAFPETPSKDIDHGTREEWLEAKKYLAQPEDKKDFDTANHFTKLVMFEQLRVVFGDTFYCQLHENSRRTPSFSSDPDKKHYFMVQAAQIAKKDLTAYFKKWGLKPEQRTIEEMSKQPKPSEDYATVAVYGPELNETPINYSDAVKWCTDNKLTLANVPDNEMKDELAQKLKVKQVEEAWILSWEGDPAPNLVLHQNGAITPEDPKKERPFFYFYRQAK